MNEYLLSIIILTLFAFFLFFELFNVIYNCLSQSKIDKQKLKNLEAEYEKIKNEKD
ncbi:MAG: hypothetical protein ACI4IK_00165 [Eubacterium sp.]